MKRNLTFRVNFTIHGARIIYIQGFKHFEWDIHPELAKIIIAKAQLACPNYKTSFVGGQYHNENVDVDCYVGIIDEGKVAFVNGYEQLPYLVRFIHEQGYVFASRSYDNLYYAKP